MESKYNKSQKAFTAMNIVNACFLGILILLTIAALVFFVADKFILNGSLSFYIINLLMDYELGKDLIQIGTTLFLPFFSAAKTWVTSLIILIPAALILVNVLAVRRIKNSYILKNICRLLVYFCFMIYIAAVSLSAVYTGYAWHVAKVFALPENFDAEKFNSVQEAVNESKKLAQHMIDVILLELQDPAANVDDLDDAQYLEVTELIAVCFQIKGTVNSREEHYLRNAFYRAPETLGDMLHAIKDKSPFDWVLLTQENTVYHMQGENGEYNVKFVSENGYHEAIYNKDGMLLTEKNDPVNMGTFNYASPIGEPALHAALDILPYYEYGNCPASSVSSKENYNYQKNPDARKCWRDLKDLLASS